MNLIVMQQGVLQWMAKVFPEHLFRNRQQRCMRFLEESLELVQSLELTKEQAIEVVEYVYGRKVGEAAQEVGGVGITLLALCSTEEINASAEIVREFDRINRPEVIAKIQAKQASKPNAVGGGEFRV